MTLWLEHQEASEDALLAFGSVVVAAQTVTDVLDAVGGGDARGSGVGEEEHAVLGIGLEVVAILGQVRQVFASDDGLNAVDGDVGVS